MDTLNFPLIDDLKIKLDHELKSIALYVASVYSIEGQLQEINHLLKIFTGNLIRQLELKKKLTDANNPLYSYNLLEKIISPRGDVYLKPTDQWQNKIIPANEKTIEVFPQLPKSLIRVSHESIIERKLHYNLEVREQINTFYKILEPNNYKRYTKEIGKKRENSGIIILLSGEPGTGKTELVKQLSKATQRDLLYFDVSKQRNMYLGESEKAIQDVFTKYGELVKNLIHPPILFFNESDNIFNKRTSNETGVSQTENAIQTILLNELERFNGILICTTNRPEAMDKAFERRFLMHIEITVPNEMVRIQLLKDNFPDLSLEVLYQLSNDHLFTAANLETYKQQKLLKRIAMNKKLNEEEELRHFLNSLHLNVKQQQIGFKYNDVVSC
jgi:AAA+ superfamily predicted ATPase